MGELGEGHGKAIVFQTDLRAKIEVQANHVPFQKTNPSHQFFARAKNSTADGFSY